MRCPLLGLMSSTKSFMAHYGHLGGHEKEIAEKQQDTVKGKRKRRRWRQEHRGKKGGKFVSEMRLGD